MLHWNTEPDPKIRGSKQTLAKKESARRSRVTVRLYSHFQEKPLALNANVSGQHPSRPDGWIEHGCDAYLESGISASRHQDSREDRE
jgi:hypothetical protein